MTCTFLMLAWPKTIIAKVPAVGYDIVAGFDRNPTLPVGVPGVISGTVTLPILIGV
jgi:hypothetical protein